MPLQKISEKNNLLCLSKEKQFKGLQRHPLNVFTPCCLSVLNHLRQMWTNASRQVACRLVCHVPRPVCLHGLSVWLCCQWWWTLRAVVHAGGERSRRRRRQKKEEEKEKEKEDGI